MEVSRDQVQDHIRNHIDPQAAKAIFEGVDLDELLDDRLDSSNHSGKGDSEFDAFDPQFKPITKGLGFNQDQSPLRPSMAASKRVGVRSQVKEGRLQLDNSPLDGNSKSSEKKTLLDQRLGLRAFYQSEQTGQSDIEVTPPKLEEKHLVASVKPDSSEKLAIKRERQKANVVQQLMAWWIDIVAVLVLTTITLKIFTVLAGVSATFIVSLLSWQELLLHLVTFISIFYLAYFTMLDTRCSLGKWIVGIRVRSDKGYRISIGQSFTRSLVSLISLFLLALPLLMDFQGKLSATKLVR
jgi:uncharacterized RDD family membrane protein YckC